MPRPLDRPDQALAATPPGPVPYHDDGGLGPHSVRDLLQGALTGDCLTHGMPYREPHGYPTWTFLPRPPGGCGARNRRSLPAAVQGEGHLNHPLGARVSVRVSIHARLEAAWVTAGDRSSPPVLARMRVLGGSTGNRPARTVPYGESTGASDFDVPVYVARRLWCPAWGVFRRRSGVGIVTTSMRWVS